MIMRLEVNRAIIQHQNHNKDELEEQTNGCEHWVECYNCAQEEFYDKRLVAWQKWAQCLFKAFCIVHG